MVCGIVGKQVHVIEREKAREPTGQARAGRVQALYLAIFLTVWS